METLQADSMEVVIMKGQVSEIRSEAEELQMVKAQVAKVSEKVK